MKRGCTMENEYWSIDGTTFLIIVLQFDHAFCNAAHTLKQDCH